MGVIAKGGRGVEEPLTGGGVWLLRGFEKVGSGRIGLALSLKIKSEGLYYHATYITWSLQRKILPSLKHSLYDRSPGTYQ